MSLAVATALALASPMASPTNVATWRSYVLEASTRFAIPVAWIERVMSIESGGAVSLNGRPIVSPKGAMGLMQLMPRTWAAMRGLYGLGRDPFDPHDNIIAGTAYLRLLYDRFGYSGLFAAYDAGPTRYAAFASGRLRLPGEAVRYLAAATSGDALAAPMMRPHLFIPTAKPSSPTPAVDPLFAIAPRL